MDSCNALEALVQRGRSPLFLELISVYQEAFDALRESPEASNETIIKTLRQTCKFPNKLKALFNKHMGLSVRHVGLVNSTLPNMTATTITPLQSVSRKHPTWTLNMAATAVASFYNDRQAKFITNPSLLHDQIMILYVTTGWWQLRDNAGSYLFTAEEAAAVTLHELGHFDYRIRTLGRIEKIMADGSDILEYVQKSPDLTTIQLILDKLSASKHLDPAWQKLLKTTKAYFSSNPNNTDPVYLEAINTLGILVESEVANLLLPNYTNLVYNSDFRSSEVKTVRHETDEERSADEFAARHGAGDGMSSFLSKFAQLAAGKSKAWLTLSMPDVLAGVVGSLLHFSQYFNLGAEDIDGGYDSMLRRLELLTETSKHAFSDSDLPEDVKVELKQQIALCEAYVSEYSNTSHRKFRLALKSWRDRVGVVGKILNTPFSDRLSHDYGNLQEATRTVSRNPLHYLAHK